MLPALQDSNACVQEGMVVVHDQNRGVAVLVGFAHFRLPIMLVSGQSRSLLSPDRSR
jgi:hypothetical protein